MRIVFRADASPTTGTGHVMRSSALAEEVISRKIEAVFVGHIENLPWVTSHIEGIGFSKIFSDDSDFISDPNSDVLILDSYSIPEDNDFIQEQKWRYVVSISDSLTPTYASSLTIFPGLESVPSTKISGAILSGPDYILLRKRIKKKFHISEDNRKIRIVVTGGGSDPFGFSRKMSEILAGLDGDFEVTFFVSQNSNSIVDSRFRFLEIGSALDDVVEEADIVFTTASTSCLEMIAREIPTGLICLVDNQVDLYESLSKLQFVHPIGRKNQEWNIDLPSIKKIIESRDLRSELITKSSGLIDLNGCSRVLDHIMSNSSPK